jgi:hypothetical protein
MRTRTKALLVGGGVLLAAAVARGLGGRRSVPEVPYETLERFDGVELRRYPPSVVVETTAPDERVAFRRLARYIDGENEASEDVAMTAPVASRSTGTDVAMTAPVRTRGDETGVTMAFYLPETYEPESAPVPIDPGVDLVVEPERTVAARQFSWFATGGRVQRMHDELLDALEVRDVEPVGEPALHRYDPPWTLPFARRNEVTVEVDVPVAELGEQRAEDVD